MEELTIELRELTLYGDTYEVWDEISKEWKDIKESCYHETGGFPEANQALYPITAITYKMNKTFYVFACDEFRNDREDVIYVKCKDEVDLIKRFLDRWSLNYPDVITGWNIVQFDIPYIINRVEKLLGEKYVKMFSPWGIVNAREVHVSVMKSYITYDPLGIAVLDYLDVYKKYAPNGKSQESYSLDNIANVELGERKLSYEEYGNLFKLLSTKSKDVVVPENKPVSEMEDFEKWIKLKNKLSNS